MFRDILYVAKPLGLLLMAFGAAYIGPIGAALVYGDGALRPFLLSAAADILFGLALWRFTRPFARDLKSRDGYLLVALAWILTAASATLPLMLALERLSPLERAALLLHDVFGLPFEEIAETLDRDVAACRQLAARARRNVRDERTRYTVDAKRGLEMAEAFFIASRSGDMTALSAMLAADVGLHSDGGGKRQAAIAPILGHAAVMKVHTYLSEKIWPAGSALLRVGLINGLPGFVTREADGELQTTALQIEDGAITAIYVMRNPDKLKHLH